MPAPLFSILYLLLPTGICLFNVSSAFLPHHLLGDRHPVLELQDVSGVIQHCIFQKHCAQISDLR